jgi:TMEM175 potassium channel family protein
VRQGNGAILWANLHLLFWLSLVPFVTGWMGENHFGARPVALYGVVLLMATIAYYILSRALIRHHGRDSALAKAIGNDFKGRISIVLYVAAIALSFSNRWIAVSIYVFVAVMWLVPDRRIEKTLTEPR